MNVDTLGTWLSVRPVHRGVLISGVNLYILGHNKVSLMQYRQLLAFDSDSLT